MQFYKRENYLKKIRGFYHDMDMIKVITGIRRCGKSCLMKTIAEEIIDSGVRNENIIYIDLDSFEYNEIKTTKQLKQAIDSYVINKENYYIFIDEIQNVDGFEELINAYRNTGRFSVFITGSNSYMLSGELVTKLTGRYIEYEMFTLTFEEYIDMKKFYKKEVSTNLVKELDNYIYEGGFPKTIFYDSLADKRTYVKSVVSEILEKDVSRRVRIQNISVFEKVKTFVINNYGATMSITSILKELKKENINVKRETLNKYIKVLIDAKIIYECKRFDLKSKRSIRGEQKYYLADLSIYYANNTDNRINYGPALENIVYFYAKSKGYEVSVGRIGKLECDFIVRDINMNYSYIQVAMTIMNSRETEEREYKSLEDIRDNYPKYLLTRNDLCQKRSGIIHKNIPDMLSEGEIF